MSWSPLAQRFAALPLILAGPLLRRTETNSVTVWLALKQPGKVILTIYQVLADGSKGAVMFTGNLRTTQLGDHLHLVAVTATPELIGTPEQMGFPLLPDVTYSYDLEFDDFDDFAGFPSLSLPNLATPGVLSIDGDVTGICYAPYWRPTFALPPADINNLHILHGSCRKPHGGEGELDALPHADTIIAATCSSATTRPHQFYHTGDQIYADDVAGVLLYLLDDAGKKLFGWVESLAPLIPGSKLDFANEAVTASLPQAAGFAQDTEHKYNIQPGQRLKVVQELAGFSSDVAGPSHLLRFAEYSCMYLFAWSDVLWPDLYPTFGQVLPWATPTLKESHLELVATPAGPAYGAGPLRERENPVKTNFDTEVDYINKFHSTLPKVRRVLANVPSYMMCDDHEVTDDWFIGFKWCKRVYGRSIDGSLEEDGSLGKDNLLGRRIVQNGLMAYALFQGWGNKPDDFLTPAGFTPFDGKPESALLGWVAKLAAERGQTQATWLSAQQKVLPATRFSAIPEQGNVAGRRTLELGVEGKLDYSFSIVFNNFLLLAINSRTERGLAANPNPRLGPALLHPAALRRQVRDKVANLPSNVQITLVICPAPVFGHAIVEGLLQKTQSKIDGILATQLPIAPMTPRNSRYKLVGTNPGGLPLLSGDYGVVENGHVVVADLDWNEGDREGWSFNTECMESLLKELSMCKKIVLFSGDVHYGFSPYVNYHRPPNQNTPGYPEQAAFMQLVCSSMKNATQIQTNALAAQLASLLINPLGYHFAGWNRSGLHYYQHLLVDESMSEILQKPYTDFEKDFFFTEVEYSGRIANSFIDTPDWHYSVHFARDNRESSVRMTYPGAAPDTAYQPPTGDVERLRYDINYELTYSQQRTGVGHNQIGQVKVDLAQAKVYHNFWYTLPGQAATVSPGPITQHILSIPSS